MLYLFDDEEENLSSFGPKKPTMSFEAEIEHLKREEGSESADHLHRRGKACQKERSYQSALAYFQLAAE